MDKFKVFFTSLLLLGLLGILGCGSDNSDTPVTASGVGTGTGTIPDITDVTDASDINKSALSVLLPVSSKILKDNGEHVGIEVKVFDGANNPYSSGSIKIVFPNDVRTGRDVGSFKNLDENLSNGLATFTYTAPKNLSQNKENIVFGFYHSANPSDVKQYTLTIEPELKQSMLTTYNIKTSLVSGSLSMGLKSNKVVSFYVVNDEGQQLNEQRVHSISMSLKNTALADIEYKGNTFSTTATMNDPDKNTLTVNMKSFTKSGIVPIDVNASFLNADDVNETTSNTFNLIIFSGPPTTMSISYEGTGHDEPNAKFQENMIISVTDKYSNRVNTLPAVSVSMIIGYAQEIAGNTKAALDSRLYVETSDAKSATINPTTNSLISSANFSNVDLSNDILMTYANGYTNAVSGKWDLINNVAMLGTNTLEILDNIPGTNNVSNIGFAIGHNYRQDTCRDGQEWTGFVELESDVLDENGMVKAVINYDYYLTGKTIALGVDLVGYTADTNLTSKFGEMRKHTLRSTGMTAVPSSWSIPKGTTAVVPFSFEIDDTGEWLRNANPGYAVKINDKTILNGISEIRTINECVGKGDGGGIVYVDINVTAVADGAGSVSLERLTVGSEF